MYKIQMIKNGQWEDVRDLTKHDKPIRYFQTKRAAEDWSLRNLGYGSTNFTRIINVRGNVVGGRFSPKYGGMAITGWDGKKTIGKKFMFHR